MSNGQEPVSLEAGHCQPDTSLMSRTTPHPHRPSSPSCPPTVPQCSRRSIPALVHPPGVSSCLMDDSGGTTQHQDAAFVFVVLVRAHTKQDS
uniref:Uncharacterized protein n=1 Tax=Knipowitschia caucasica TaxID=637954 RepID=A0AAV2M092_KNICA